MFGILVVGEHGVCVRVVRLVEGTWVVVCCLSLT